MILGRSLELRISEVKPKQFYNCRKKELTEMFYRCRIKTTSTKVENKSIRYVTNDEIEANQILEIFRKNQVTPINSEEVIVDLFRKKF